MVLPYILPSFVRNAIDPGTKRRPFVLYNVSINDKLSTVFALITKVARISNISPTSTVPPVVPFVMLI